VKALSVKRPWADWIISGRKPVENRTWRTWHRGPLLIHASGAGLVLGAVTVVDCVLVEEAPAGPDTEGPWCWILAAPVRLPRPVPCKGRLGMWTPPAGVLAAVLAQLRPRHHI
jgi:hypothetical protein